MIGALLHGRWERRLVLHFARTLGPRREAELRRHLEGCDCCRAAYGAMLLAEGGEASARRDRLEAALFGAVDAEVTKQPGGWSPLRLAAVAAPALLVLVLGALVATGRLGDGGLTAKGGVGQASRYVSIAVYQRAGAGATMRPVSGSVPPDAALALAYTNRADEGFDRLLIFGVDEHATVYWYYPAWTDPKVDPRAFPIERGAGIELPDAVTHALEGRRLRLFALFSRRRDLSVKRIERIVARLRREQVRVDRLDRFPVDGTGQHSILLEVTQP